MKQDRDRHFERIYNEQFDAVMGYSVKRCRDPHEVSDLCAATFVAVWQSLDSFDPDRGSETSWILGIAARRLADLRRTDARRLRLSERLASIRLLDADDIEQIASRIDAEREAPAAVAAVNALPEGQREAFVRVDVEGHSAESVSETTNTRPSTVRMRLMRARRTLRPEAGSTPEGSGNTSEESA